VLQNILKNSKGAGRRVRTFLLVTSLPRGKAASGLPASL
jgi:hypothetical protein